MPDTRNAEFSFKIDFARGHGDPRRIFDAASLLIEGFSELDETLAASMHSQLETRTVLQDIQPGSLRVILRTILTDIDDQALKDGEYKKAIGPALVRAKHLALKALDSPAANAPKAVEDLRAELQNEIAQTEIRHLPAYGPIHDAQLVGSLDKLQDAKRTLATNDKLTIETEDKVYEVDLTKTWSPAETIQTKGTTEKESTATVILTIKKADMLGDTMWQFTHGNANVFAPIKDFKWLQRFHDGKIPLHSGDALRCRVKFTYVFDEKNRMIDQKTEILKVLSVIKGPGHQTSMFDEQS
jgi:hypothetical protein